MTHPYVTCLIHMYDMTHPCARQIPPVASKSSRMGWLQSVGSIKLQVSFAKEPYKRDEILHKRPAILSILLTVATPYANDMTYSYVRNKTHSYV